MRMVMLTSTEIVYVSGLSPWIYHGPARFGWDGLASGGRVRCGGESRSARRTRGVHVYMREPHQPPAVIEPYVGSGTIT